MIEKEGDFLLIVSSGAEGSEEDESTAKLETALAVSPTEPSITFGSFVRGFECEMASCESRMREREVEDEGKSRH